MDLFSYSKEVKLLQTSKDYFPPVTGSLIDVQQNCCDVFVSRFMCRCVNLILGNELCRHQRTILLRSITVLGTKEIVMHLSSELTTSRYAVSIVT